MREYGKISTSVWNSQKFSTVSDDAKLLYLYLHTCPSVNSIGCFVLKQGYAIADLGWKPYKYSKAMDSLCKVDLCAFDSGENLVRIVNFLNFEPFANSKHAQGAMKLAFALPDCVEKLNVFKDIERCTYVNDSALLTETIDRLSTSYQDPEPEPKKAENQLTSTPKKKVPRGKKVFKGTRIPDDWALTDELADYARIKGISDEQIANEAEKFKNYWLAASGTAGIKRNWDAAWRNWIIKAVEYANGQTKRSSGHAGQRSPMQALVAGFEQAALEGAERDKRERGKRGE